MAKPLLRVRPVVLVIDDDADARVIFRHHLSVKGCRVLTARHGALGIAKAVRYHPDVIVLDLAMPQLDGWSVARRLRRRPATADIPIIAVSAVPVSRVSAHAAGCDVFVAKPCPPELLWCEIQLVLHDPARPRFHADGALPFP